VNDEELKELLELAAKAAGIVGVYEEENRMIREFVFQTRRHIRTANGSIWNPLDDDSDALRLAVALDMCLDFGYLRGKYVHNGDDFNSYIRKCIVIAAAEHFTQWKD